MMLYIMCHQQTKIMKYYCTPTINTTYLQHTSLPVMEKQEPSLTGMKTQAGQSRWKTAGPFLTNSASYHVI